MNGLDGLNESMGLVLLEYDRYVDRCHKENKKPLSFLGYLRSSLKGTL